MERPFGDEPTEEEVPVRIQEDDGSGKGSQWDDDHVIEIFKDSDLYLAAKNGNLDDFERLLHRVSAADDASLDDTLCRLSTVGNTFVHIAAKHGNQDIVTLIAATKPSLVLSKNFHGETALHLAAKAGHAITVRVLVKIQKLVLQSLSEPDENNLLRAKNERGNTALHEALSNGQDLIAKYLIQNDHELTYYKNKNGESALYLAAKAGFADCVSLILGLSTDEERLIELFKRNSPILAAIQGKNRDVLEAIFDMKPSFIQLKDGERRNPLHYAASLGYLKVVHNLHNQYAENATQRDKNGALPIHLASTEGHIDVVRLLLEDFPDPGELLDRDGRNILHLAAMHKRYNIVNFVLKNPDLEDLVNMKDKEGNTPLHLAAEHWHPMIVSSLTWNSRVDIKSINDKGMTALDIAECYRPKSNTHQFTQWLTKVALEAAGTPRHRSASNIDAKKRPDHIDFYKDRVNILLLVLTLVATVTFAAGFTVPGGYNSSESDSDPGMATMLRRKAFHIFVICDSLAMYSSIVAVVALIWAHLGDIALLINALGFVVPFYLTSLGMMSMAFMAGVFLVVSKLRWLGIAVLVMGITFLVILFLVFLPLCIPVASRNWVVRYLTYYPFYVLVQATQMASSQATQMASSYRTSVKTCSESSALCFNPSGEVPIAGTV